ncbi:MAG TPA: adenylate/guanylate cyclase domain-containing protein [Candidatus Binataceae bacterium]|nr:adenylate/guanylate cyclase domain-containing protein [Candidatus Binataceae bacterium]
MEHSRIEAAIPMQCPKCDAENAEGLKFCEQCGAPFQRRCPSCEFDNSPTARFCGQCGASLAPASATAKPAPVANAPAIAAEGERRHLTVLFSDLVGSTEIATHLDPKEWREIAAQYQRTAAEAVTQLGGHVAKYLGDGLVVYFGYPEAHEDDAERAVRAGLAVVEAVAELNRRLAAEHKPVQLAVRVGIHTGSVVVGAGGGAEADVFGDVPNIASRVQTAASPNSVLITAAVEELVAGLFVAEDRGAQELKGVEQPVRLYRAIKASYARRRSHRTAERIPSPFVGREDEVRLLLSRWERTREGQGQFVLVAGEAGIGKSRLLEEFRARIKPDTHRWVECAGEQFFESTPFHAATQMIGEAMSWHGGESKEERLEQLEMWMSQLGLKPREAVPLIAEMLDLPVPEKFPPLLFAPDQKRKRLFSVLARWVFGVATLKPLVMVMEDMHWVDPSTLELAQVLVEQGATAPLMLIFTARPEFRMPWPMRSHHAQITLNRLNDRQTREMVAGVAARAALAKDVIEAVVKRTDGVPLFAEELTRLMLDGGGRAVAHDIPATLHDSLTARLDRLGPARNIAQIAAVIGREFSYELLEAVAHRTPAELHSALDALADRELIYARGIPPDATYQFKHALIQDAAYEALLKSRRKELHRRVAQTIADRFPQVGKEQPQVLARHWTGAGEAKPAISAWKKAGAAANARRAFKEAEEDYRQALAMLETLPESPERAARELELARLLVEVLQLTKGYSAPETIEAAGRARRVAEKVGNLTQLVMQGFGAWAAVHVSGDHPSAAALADQILDLATRDGGTAALGFAHSAAVHVNFYRGNLAAVEEHFSGLNETLDSVDSSQVPAAAAITICHAAVGAWTLGYADKARRRIGDAIAFAAKNNNPYSMAFGRFLESWLYLWLRDPQRASAAAMQALDLSKQHGFSYITALGRIIQGWSRAQLGDTAEGVALIREGLWGVLDIGARLGITFHLTCLAEAQALDGEIDDALATIEDSLQANPEELIFLPNIMTCRGILRLKLGQPEPAERDFREAIALAVKMNAKAWELQAAICLAQMLQARGEGTAAAEILTPICGWFTEGFDTADLCDAKKLLAVSSTIE